MECASCARDMQGAENFCSECELDFCDSCYDDELQMCRDCALVERTRLARDQVVLEEPLQRES